MKHLLSPTRSASLRLHEAAAKLCMASAAGDTRYRMMRCKGGLPPLMICTALCAVMIYQACGLDKKSTCISKCFFGGGRWIRTTEVSDNRFTVCPLWPLGNSPIFGLCCGAGGRIRTPDLLITNQLLYRLSYTSTASHNDKDYSIDFLKCQGFFEKNKKVFLEPKRRCFAPPLRGFILCFCPS